MMETFVVFSAVLLTSILGLIAEKDTFVKVSTTTPEPTKSRVRLVNGTQASNGRLEIFIDGDWGTICDDSFDSRDATVACRMLGYTGKGLKPKVRRSTFYGPGTGKILLDDLECSGCETDLLECQHPPIGVHNCVHNDDVGINCSPDDKMTTTTPGPNKSSVRLVNGTQRSNGRLEIFINGFWGTICDDGFDAKEAKVACTMLGYPGLNPEVRGSAFYGSGTGQILLADVECSGSETDLLECQHPPIGVHNCGHNEDVGIICTPEDKVTTTTPGPNKSSVRLVNGTEMSNGRLEILINGFWGTICDDSFDARDAKVACTMLGYPGLNPEVRGSAFYGSGTGQILLDDVECSGSETDLLECQHPPIGVHNCGHNEDVGIICTPGDKVTTTTPGPNKSSVRLVNGTEMSNGRLEILINGFWGTICDDSFDARDAKVACTMLGYPGLNPEVRGSAFYGSGTGQILLDDVECSGSETDLLECQHPPIGVHNCGHNEDVGIICTPGDKMTTTTPGPNKSSVRLVNGTEMSNGRLEILINGFWGTICDDSFDARDAKVACTMLGYPGLNPEVRGSAFYGSGTGQILLDDVECSGSETDLLECQHPPIGVHNCGHNEDVGIICTSGDKVTTTTPGPTKSSVRLVNGTQRSNGRLEILINGFWGTICDDSFDAKDAKVACIMLGYPGLNPEVRGSAFYGSGNGEILLDDVECSGSETDLLECQHPPIGVHNCGHNEDVGIICTTGDKVTTTTPGPNKSSVRLVNGTQMSNGRLEIFINGFWGTICDDSFDAKDAKVACTMLGYSGLNPEVRGSAFYGSGIGQILLDDVECSGSETDLLECQHPPIGVHNCGHNEDVGIICTLGDKVTTTTPGPNKSSVRLVNGTEKSNGRLEVFINGFWGTVCDDSFDAKDAKVACTMLGYPGLNPEVRGSAFYGSGTGQILLDDVECSGSETDLLACQHPPIGVHDCGHKEDVGIICTPA